MGRQVGVSELLHSALPEDAAIGFALLTQLGDVWFLGVLVATLYVLNGEKREQAAVVAALFLGGLGLITGLKHAFALPRPEALFVSVDAFTGTVRSVYAATAAAGGYGFPSGHALLSTVVYLGLVDYFSVSTRRRRLTGAGAIIVLVSFTRVALGVHYVVDVVAGIAFGGLFFLGTRRLLNRSEIGRTKPLDRVTTAYGVAIGMGAFGAAAAGGDLDGLLVFGISLGALVGRQFLGRE